MKDPTIEPWSECLKFLQQCPKFPSAVAASQLCRDSRHNKTCTDERKNNFPRAWTSFFFALEFIIFLDFITRNGRDGRDFRRWASIVASHPHTTSRGRIRHMVSHQHTSSLGRIRCTVSHQHTSSLGRIRCTVSHQHTASRGRIQHTVSHPHTASRGRIRTRYTVFIVVLKHCSLPLVLDIVLIGFCFTYKKIYEHNWEKVW